MTTCGFIEFAEDVQTYLPSPPKQLDIPEPEDEIQDQFTTDAFGLSSKNRERSQSVSKRWPRTRAPSSMRFLTRPRTVTSSYSCKTSGLLLLPKFVKDSVPQMPRVLLQTLSVSSVNCENVIVTSSTKGDACHNDVSVALALVWGLRGIARARRSTATGRPGRCTNTLGTRAPMSL